MSDEKFNLVFKGELAKSFTLEQAKANLSKLFKISGPKLDALFSGKPVILKKNMDFDTASKYRVAIKKAGGLVHLVEVAAPKPQTPPQPKATFGLGSPADAPTARAQEPVAGQLTLAPMDTPPPSSPRKASFGVQPPSAEANVESAVAQQVTQATGNFGVAPAGTALADQHPDVPAPDVDVSGMTISETGADLLTEAEKTAFVPAEVDTSAMDLAEPGVDLLNDDEKSAVVEVDIDLSALSVADVGTRLEDPKPAPPPAPDVSKIQLAD